MFRTRINGLIRAPGGLALAFLALFAATVLAVGNGPVLAAEAGEIEARAARIAGDATRTRFVVDLTDAVEIAPFVLGDPHRIIVDLPNVRFALPPEAGKGGRGLITGWRYGSIARNKARIVIDTKGPALIDKSFVLPKVDDQPARMVLDIVTATEEAFAEEVARTANAAQAGAVTAGKGDRQPIRNKERTRPLIVLDPGHGGIDSGAVGKKGTLEKAVVLDFASVLKRKLEETGRFEVALTRSDDSFIPLKQRVEIARGLHADLFVSVHADSVRQAYVRGGTVYTLSERASDRLAAQIARNENQSDILAGLEFEEEADDVSDILIDLTRRETKNFSVYFANALVGELQSAVKMINNPHRSAGFVVLKAADVPSVLVELGYLSNAHDEQLLTSDEWRGRAADAITAAITRFFEPRIAHQDAAIEGNSIAGVAPSQQ
ncbi:N-acetylmuramoyl-L-alanine amidase [Rhodobium gokarnense]|uniref:N-acetylmuramoyl-L-alanine amidase n=1 Tax=Rhodobium gokarnense TaxID=364296 RepID=A0ABT3HAJ4_9HYPH|nr:N-acetylmuramoyl-L-alanine amidase [Rhodobium gokarnense]MCW2307417.1 N-acetylmuramoyl-L-alanine amidase [Rhodobium gokarnense]